MICHCVLAGTKACEKCGNNTAVITQGKSVSIAERKRGNWQKILADIGYCSVCNEQIKSDEFEYYRYCPNCGAKMGGVEE